MISSEQAGAFVAQWLHTGMTEDECADELVSDHNHLCPLTSGAGSTGFSVRLMG